jgi:hypothetical protein
VARAVNPVRQDSRADNKAVSRAEAPAAKPAGPAVPVAPVAQAAAAAEGAAIRCRSSAL